jgi:putative DNA primase/helicase
LDSGVVVVDHGWCKPGLWHFGIKEATENKAAEYTCSCVMTPMSIRARTSDGRGFGFGRVFEFIDSNGELRDWAAPMEMLAGSGEDLRAGFLDRGAVVYPEGHRL